ncbi:hypothetical protein [Enterococcus casseliflavus]|uniref:hypothetical protein n=1 Tax=Enterococcus casseliflavus TaxID=37734 RepID=UPI0022E08448|nr:hypothetical protein [Enterococcus casseliflavus]MEB6088083.1 hypothetical protein [Enterococcus casseliflavus]
MRKMLAVFFVSLCFIVAFASISTINGRATTKENRAVVSFYQEEEIAQPAKEDAEKLPQAGSTFSYMGILGVIIVFFTCRLKVSQRKM